MVRGCKPIRRQEQQKQTLPVRKKRGEKMPDLDFITDKVKSVLLKSEV